LRTPFGDFKSKKGILIVISGVLVIAPVIGVHFIPFVQWKSLGLKKWKNSR